MAIVIGQERRQINWFNVMVIILILAFIGISVYFLFFAEKPLVEMALSGRFQTLKEVSQFQFKPEEVTEHETFKSLKLYGADIDISEVGRSNPFIAP